MAVSCFLDSFLKGGHSQTLPILWNIREPVFDSEAVPLEEGKTDHLLKAKLHECMTDWHVRHMAWGGMHGCI